MIAAIVQARMGSSRLPGKVLRTAAGKTFLEHLHARLGQAATIGHIVIATSTLPGDDAIARLCQKNGYNCFRGSEQDVLDRYFRAAQEIKADTVVRITADCPLIDPAIVDQIVSTYLEQPGRYDLVTNRHPLTFPDGLDVDVMSFAALEQAWHEATTPPQREHVIPYFWETGKRVFNVEHPGNLFPRYRWTLDYEEDARVIEAIFDALYKPDGIFGLDDIKRFVDSHPEIAVLNAAYLPAWA
jgi:spore coat polysaccharide biosynthesis protein SpsF